MSVKFSRNPSKIHYFTNRYFFFVAPRENFGHVSRLSPTTIVPLLDTYDVESNKSRVKFAEREPTRYMTLISLPEQVFIGSSSIPGIKLGVFTNCWIKEGTHMGPFTGHILKRDEINYNVDNNLMWEVRK